MSDSIQLSVILPVYNVEAYLRQSLDSVLAQDMEDMEIICVDDGSTDGSPRILEEYAQRDSRIRIITQKNQYLGVARNNGLAQARGEFIHFLDSDDWLVPGVYRKLCRLAREHDVDFCSGGYFIHNERSGEQQLVLPEIPAPYLFPCTLQSYPELFNQGVMVWNKIYRRSFLEENQIRYDDYRDSEDRLFTCWVAKASGKFLVVREPLVYYRQFRPSSNTMTPCKRSMEYRIRSFREIWEMYREEGPEVKVSLLRYLMIDMDFFYYHILTEENQAFIHGQVHDFFCWLDLSELRERLLEEEWYPFYLLCRSFGPEQAQLMRDCHRELKNCIVHKNTIIHKLRERISLLENSTFWRMTGPLRRVLDSLRALRRR